MADATDNTKGDQTADKQATETPTPTPTPTPAPAPAAKKEKAAPAADKVVTNTPAPAPAVAETVTETVEAPAAEEADDNALVTELKGYLNDFATLNKKIGSDPKDFRESANMVSLITRFIIRGPKPPILNAFLAFVEEHKKDCCSGTNYMKGVDLLPQMEQQRIGYLFNLFSDVANGVLVRVDQNQIIRVLGKHEFVQFLSRRQAVMAQNQAQ